MKFVANLRRYGNADRTVILKASSLDLRPSAIHEHADDLRFVSIDGGHWHEAVLNDLRLAANCAAPQCVIAIDDFFNADYPNVAAAFYQWLDEKPDFAPFAASRGKLYLCRRGEGSAYQEALLSSRYLRWQLKKEATFLGVKVLQFTGLPSGWRGRAKKYLETYAPAVLDSLARRGLARRN